ncbi:Surface antigen [Tistlia consotensis]|uniref:Surface antigen n=1 Tax=Tistlia consotensis USBA 355 TaxID=560819 RepID=A0A1Y6CLL9_9PROT|nr:RT0821/Lpp0805 family surface protein [Tistlia consotensis]SMF60792.1 Surface antigen [Tistlia consotensis USBA 355]SNR92698.1 Surface antigen [Tistlia consotensis]
MKTKILLAALFAGVLAVAGCSQDGSGYGTKQTIGGLGGAALGGLLGSQFGGGTANLAFTALGAVAGGLVGSEVGKGLDKADKLEAQQAQAQARTAPINQTITWSNPDTGHSGSYTPVREGYRQDGAYCREFQETVTINNQQQKAYGVACQQPDGTWRIVEQK